MKKRFHLILLTVFLVAAGSGGTYARALDPVSPFIPYEMSVLPNGLRVIVKEIPAYPTAAVNMWVGVGAKDDPLHMSGMAHFFEHLLFKGTTTRPVGQIGRDVEKLGGYINAMTSYDFTTFFVVVPSDKVMFAMEIQADAIRNSSFVQEEIDKERNVIFEEIRVQEDSPTSKLASLVLQSLLTGTSYARPVLGSVEDLGNINRAEMADFHKEYYVPNNMTLVVVGDVNGKEIMEAAFSLYGDMEGKSLVQPRYAAVPSLSEVQRITEKRLVDQAYGIMAFPGPAGDRDAMALSVAGILLGVGQSSRLFQELMVEKRLVTDIAANYEQLMEVGALTISFSAPQENLEQIEAALKGQIERLQTELVSDGELGKAQAMARSSFAFAAESNAQLALVLGQYETFGGVNNAVNWVDVLESITAEDVLRVAQEYLNLEGYVWGEIIPEGGSN